MHELPHELLNNVTIKILGNQEMSRKSLKCLELMAIIAAQKIKFSIMDFLFFCSVTQKTIFDKSAIKLRKD